MTNRTGFTLVELLASLTISAMLLVSLMGMTAHLARAAKQIRQAHPVEDWQNVLAHRLQTDYRNARAIVVHPTEVVLESKGIPQSQLDGDQVLMDVPMRIRYSIQSNDQVFALTRTEQVLTGGIASRTEFLATGIVGFRSDQPLATDVAPGVLGLEVYFEDVELPEKLILMRHGMRDQ